MAAPFTFIHAADLHLDTPFQGIGAVSPELRKRLRDATLDAFDALVRLAIEEEAAFLVIAGDIYDGPAHGIRPQIRLAGGFARLAEAGINVFLSSGNHDPLWSRGWQAALSWPGNVRFFRDRPESFPVARDGEVLARVHGMSYPRREVRENLAADFSRHPDPVFQVGVLHATVGARQGHEEYAPATMETLVASGLDYWALGHVHTRSTLRDHAPFVAYPGNTQALSPRETGPRGALVVEVSETGSVTSRFRPLDRVRFARVDLDVSAAESLADLTRLLGEGADTARSQAEGRDLVLNAVLSGQTPLHAALSAPEAMGDLLEELRGREEGTEPLAWWSGLDDRTAPPLDLANLREQEGLPGALLDKAEALAADPALLAGMLREAWDDLDGHAASCRLFGKPGAEESEALLREAQFLVLERLLAEAPR